MLPELDHLNFSVLEHYILTLILSVIIVVITVIVSKIYATKIDFGKKDTKRSEVIYINKPDDKQFSTINSKMKRPLAAFAESMIHADMTEEQLLCEKEVRQQQLIQIYELMKQQSNKFGEISLSDVEEQMKLYQ
ncbi:uncharacterized protein LOC118186260 isoform X1 [Stegodyphus dumicola]|uniref:uncharacterized protein LOC118186260 isoform X1 n=1 Tax=Stegodyphus dumicola TaxID=202533 RepID=UPI0015A93B0A|nr:uncharacterized protein LOC118186260 isoform X1 [Stegodyphus dumicola]XP_035212242.1 uncharacterized protein LOC118186260 isoform X1 [Stegodyphus dumicola]